MFDFFDTSKLLIIAAVAIMVIPPKDLPGMLRQLGQAVGKLRRMAAEFQGQINDALREAELDTLKKDLQDVADKAKADLNAQLGRTDEPEKAASVAPGPATVEMPDTLAAPHPLDGAPAFAEPLDIMPEIATKAPKPRKAKATVQTNVAKTEASQMGVAKKPRKKKSAPALAVAGDAKNV